MSPAPFLKSKREAKSDNTLQQTVQRNIMGEHLPGNDENNSFAGSSIIDAHLAATSSRIIKNGISTIASATAAAISFTFDRTISSGSKNRKSKAGLLSRTPLVDIDSESSAISSSESSADSDIECTMDTTPDFNSYTPKLISRLSYETAQLHPFPSSFVENIEQSSLIAHPRQPSPATIPDRPHPLYIPEIISHIFSFLDTQLIISADPNKPIDFVKVDSIKYTIARPKLHSCVLVSRLWNACATTYLWKNVRLGSAVGCIRLSQILGPINGQMRRLETSSNTKWTTTLKHLATRWSSTISPLAQMECNSVLGVDEVDFFSECASASIQFLPSLVNGWIYGEIIKTFTLIPPHGPDSANFEAVDIDFLVSVLAISCPKLEELNLSTCVRVTDKSIVLIARSCPRLRKLNLNRCDLISSVSVSAIAEYCRELAVVNLSRPLLQQKTCISDDSIYDLVTKSKNLMELRLRNCEMVTDRTVVAMALNNGHSLRALDLSWCGKLTDNSITRGIAKHCNNLISLAMNGCKKLTDISIACLLKSCPTIGSLSLAHLPCITDLVITRMAENLSGLTILSLNGCNNVSDHSVIAIADNCPNLQSLSLFSLGITDAAVQSLAKGCLGLTSLSISGCTQVTDEGAIYIANLASLQSLYLNGTIITDRSIVSISNQCRSIRALSLNDCKDLTDRSILALSKYCANLQSLSMNGCSVTAVSVKALVERCSDLRELSIRKCKLCALDGPESKKVISGNGGMQHLTAVGEQVLQKIRKRRIALILRED